MTEVANTLARKAMAGLMSAAGACVYLRSLPHYFGGFLAVDELIEPALKNACAIRHPIYDLIYLEAARRLDAQLVTADRRFIAKIAGTDFARHVMLLSDWRPGWVNSLSTRTRLRFATWCRVLARKKSRHMQSGGMRISI